MTRKDYELLAKALRDSRPSNWDTGFNGSSPAIRAQWWRDREQISLALASNNPRFDIAKFYAATEK